MTPLARKLLFLSAALLGLAVPAPAATAAPATSAASLLYVQESAGGSLTRLGHGAYRLRLTGVSPRVSTFTDRPRRRAGSQGLQGFVESWPANGFRTDPPNAALVSDHAPASRDVALLTLSHPRYDRARRTLTYRAVPLQGTDATFGSFGRRADPVRAGKLGPTSLFIDDGGSTTSADVTFSVINATATTNLVQFGVSGPGASFDPSGSFSISGQMISNGLFTSPTALTFELSPGTSLDFQLSVAIEHTVGQAPTVEVNNVSGIIVVTWPTAEGPQTQTLFPGDPMTLAGLAP